MAENSISQPIPGFQRVLLSKFDRFKGSLAQVTFPSDISVCKGRFEPPEMVTLLPLALLGSRTRTGPLEIKRSLGPGELRHSRRRRIGVSNDLARNSTTAARGRPMRIQSVDEATGRLAIMSVDDDVAAVALETNWLEKIGEASKRRGTDTVTRREINVKIAAARHQAATLPDGGRRPPHASAAIVRRSRDRVCP